MKTKEAILEELQKQNPSSIPVFKAMDVFAKHESIEFAKWINKEGWEEYDESDRWICPSNNRNVYLTSSLYELFKKANP